VLSHPSPERKRRMGHPVIVVSERRERQPLAIPPFARFSRSRSFDSRRPLRRTPFAQDDSASSGFVLSHPSPERRRRMGHPVIVVGEHRERQPLAIPPFARFSRSRSFGSRRPLRRTMVAQDDSARSGFVLSHPSPERRRRMGHPVIVVGERHIARDRRAARNSAVVTYGCFSEGWLATWRWFSTLNTPGTPLARMLAVSLSDCESTTP
jgi:hypothetical protein